MEEIDIYRDILMEVDKIFYMMKGVGENSYVNNFLFQVYIYIYKVFMYIFK